MAMTAHFDGFVFRVCPLFVAAALGALAAAGCGGDGGASAQSGVGGATSSGQGSSTGSAPTSGTGGSASSSSSSGGGGAPPNNGYYTEGNLIKKSDGTPHLFHGLARPSLEWNASGEMLSKSDYDLIKGWSANVVRLSLNQQFWLKDSASYKETVAQNIQWAKETGMDVIVDLHWSDKGDLNGQAGQQRMADKNSVQFWAEVAAKYKEDGRVIFELYNEPHDVSWDVWKNGGQSGDGFEVAGMQELYDTVRGAGAENLILIGGLDYAFDLSGVPEHRINGYNIVYVSHPYDFPGKQPADWEEHVGFLTQTDPVMFTEFGVINGSCSADYYSKVIQFADEHTMSWTGWAWYPKDCTFPSLISNWGGTPTEAGQTVKNALLSY